MRALPSQHSFATRLALRTRRQGLAAPFTHAQARPPDLLPRLLRCSRRLVTSRAVSAPELRDATLPSPSPRPPPPGGRVTRRLLTALSNLPLALGEMAALATLSAVGTVIEQNKSVAHYVEKYPLDHGATRRQRIDSS